MRVILPWVVALQFILAPTDAWCVYLFSPTVVPGQLIGHKNSNPPVPLYGPDKLSLSYLVGGKRAAIEDDTGLLTLIIAQDALASINRSKKNRRRVQAKYRSQAPETVLSALKILEAKIQSGELPDKTRLLDAIISARTRINRDGIFDEIAQARLKEIISLVSDRMLYTVEDEPQPVNPRDYYYSRIRGSRIESRPENFLYRLSTPSTASQAAAR